MVKNLKTLSVGERAKIIGSHCEERFAIFGISVGREIQIVCESLIRGTICIQTESSKICVRREELDLILKILEEKGDI